MPVNVHAFDLDISKEPVSLNSLTIGQGDQNGTTVQASIYDNGTAFALANYSVYFNMLLPDGKTMYRQAGTKSGNVATVVIDETYAGQVAGTTNVAYFTFEQSGTVIASTERLSVRILRSATDGEPAQSWVSGLDELISAMEDALAAARAASLAANQSASDIAAQMANQQAAYTSAESGRDTQYGTAEAARDARAAEALERALQAVSDLSELYVPVMSATVHGGAKLGDGLLMDNGYLKSAIRFGYETVGGDELPYFEIDY